MFIYNNHFLQKEGRNRIKIVNNSSLPKIIPMLNIHFEISGIFEKFPFEPISEPKPGPTFDIDVAAPEIEVIKSRPVIDNSAVKIKKIIIYKKIKEIIEAKNLSFTVLFSYLIKTSENSFP